MGSLGSNQGPSGGWSLKGKVALITGAGRGLGAGLAEILAERGANVVINYANSAKAAMAVVDRIEKAGGKAVAVQANVSKTPEVTRLFEQAVAHFGRLDIVINNSGMEAFSAEEDVTEELYDQVFGLNTRAQFFVGQHALKHLSRKSPPVERPAALVPADGPAQVAAALFSCRRSRPKCPA